MNLSPSLRLACAIVLVALCLAPDARAADTTTIEVGNIPSLTAAPLYIAKEKGYYQALGLDVHIEYSGTPSDTTALLATNRLQAVGGSLSAGLFNSLITKLPIQLAVSRLTSPFYHYIMVRPALKDVFKKPADLKGHTIAIDAPSSNLGYELENVLRAGGLTLDDVQIKYLEFSSMVSALQNGAIDAAVMVSPLQDATAAKGIAVKWLNTDTYMKKPAVGSVLEINSDWAATHLEAAKSFIAATLHGARDYCNAYHHGPNRAEVVRILALDSNVHDPDLIDSLPWGGLDVTGRIPEQSVMDIQDYFLAHKLTTRRLTWQDLAPPAWIADMQKQLPRFILSHDDGKPGCR